MRVNRGQDLVIAGYTPSLKNFDAFTIGYYEGEKLAAGDWIDGGKDVGTPRWRSF